MQTQHDLLALYRHLLRSGDVAPARRLGRALVRDSRFRPRALAELRRLPFGEPRHTTQAGLLLDGLLDDLDPLGKT